jgi:hypothetical protein
MAAGFSRATTIALLSTKGERKPINARLPSRSNARPSMLKPLSASWIAAARASAGWAAAMAPFRPVKTPTLSMRSPSTRKRAKLSAPSLPCELRT